MDYIDQLLTIVEISVALAGFAGIVATFQVRNQSSVSHGQATSLSMIVNISLIGAFFAALPIGLLNLGIEEPIVWSISSLLLGVNQLAFGHYVLKNSAIASLSNLIRNLYILLFILSILVAIANLLNALGIFFSREFGPIYFTFLFNFSVVGFTFSRLLMYPLWKSIRENAQLSS